MAWHVLHYQPVATFELRPSNTTKTGGKTLLCPTPYTIKMALLDRAIRINGLAWGQDAFPVIRDLAVWLRLPDQVAVNRTFQKILRPGKGASWIPTIAMREFCVQAGTLQIALGVPEVHETFGDDLRLLASAINYFGQRGSFVQLIDHLQTDAPPPGFVDATQPTPGLQMGFLQRMDDMAPDVTFDDVSAFNPRAKGGRVAYNVVFPYHVLAHAANHTVWHWKEHST
jgi:hypothetical protein